ncbi:MAG: sugar phosphate isomerase/epimerase [Candidatus Riflebacteria bacterium]|nr:sugar phosphate isomerase/epimerase [Candidatus Riflebacteria bacterium]
MKPKIHVNIPIRHLRPEDFDLLCGSNLQPEIYFASDLIDEISSEKYCDLINKFTEKNFVPSLHAPFFDLNIGAFDPKVRAITLERILWSFKAAKDFKATHVVIHPGYGPWALTKKFDEWLDRTAPLLKKIVQSANELGLKICFENIYDSTPDDLKKMISEFPEETVGICFDTGHFNLFSQTSMQYWFDTLGSRIFEVHLHDNGGEDDDHIAIGDGCVKYSPLIKWYQKNPTPPILTIEMVLKTHIIKSIPKIREWFEN